MKKQTEEKVNSLFFAVAVAALVITAVFWAVNANAAQQCQYPDGTIITVAISCPAGTLPL
jgi:hypothetical protein